MYSQNRFYSSNLCKEWLMLIWIRALLSTAAEINTLEGRDVSWPY